MSETYDLTTTAGLRAAAGKMKFPVAYLLAGPVGLLVAAASSLMPVSKDQQVKAVKKLLSEGRKQNVKRMKIKMSNDAAGEIGGGVEGCSVKIAGRVGDVVEMDVEYK